MANFCIVASCLFLFSGISWIGVPLFEKEPAKIRKDRDIILIVLCAVLLLYWLIGR